MTLDEARASIGCAVVYDPGHGGPREDGTLVRIGDSEAYVYVRFSHNDASIKMTPLSKLTLLGGS